MNPLIPFSQILDALKNDHTVHLPHLYRLSDMEAEEIHAFQAQWPTFSDERRRLIARHLVDITGENYLVDFERVFTLFLADRDAPVRQAALEGLWDSTHVRHVAPILRLLETDEDNEVRARGARTLGNYTFQSLCGLMPEHVAGTILPALLRVLESPDTAAVVRRSALESASYAEDKRIDAFIWDAYDHGDYQMQVSALNAMGINGALRWLPTVLDELESPYEEMRLAAIRAAGHIGDVQAITQLVRLIEEEEYEIQAAAVEALAAIGGEVAERVLLDMLEDPQMESLYEVIEKSLDDVSWSNVLDDYPFWNMEPDALLPEADEADEEDAYDDYEGDDDYADDDASLDDDEFDDDLSSYEDEFDQDDFA